MGAGAKGRARGAARLAMMWAVAVEVPPRRALAWPVARASSTRCAADPSPPACLQVDEEEFFRIMKKTSLF